MLPRHKPSLASRQWFSTCPARRLPEFVLEPLERTEQLPAFPIARALALAMLPERLTSRVPAIVVQTQYRVGGEGQHCVGKQ